MAISDFCAPLPVEAPRLGYEEHRAVWERVASMPFRFSERPEVRGSYLERLPLAAVRAGLCRTAEIWTFRGDDQAITSGAEADPDAPAQPVRRCFRADGPAPYPSTDILAHLEVFGAPEILCVWGLGIDAAILRRCHESVRVYNSIDAPALRIPDEALQHIDLFLASAPWQEDAIRAKRPDALVAVMPIGPEFASPETFHPTGSAKDFDVIYVAAAQGYKRHDILLDAFDRLPRSLKGLCVFGYGEDAEAIRGEIAARGLEIACIGPPGAPYAEVNALMNRARIGVVCGEADGAPAILTEYMLAGLPVLANANLSCGLQFIRPETGLVASAEAFADGILELLERAPRMAPRGFAIEHWGWETTIERFSAYVDRARRRKSRAA